MPTLLDFNSFCENLQEVTSVKILDKKKFHPKGLFSEQIFGPERNYTCQCGIYYGPSKTGKCDICGVDIVHSDERRSRFAKIVLPIPVVNPIMYDLLCDIGGNDVKGALDSLMRNEKAILYFDADEPVVVTSPESIPSTAKKFEKIEAIQMMIEVLSKNLATDDVQWKLVHNNIDRLILKQILVLPPDLRPAAKGISKNNQVLDRINRFYSSILQKKEIMRDTIISIERDKNLFYTYFKQLQKDVNELYQHILEKLSKKEGLIRGNILGKRIDFSGRAVIAPDPTLNLDECALPYLMFMEIFKITIAKKLIEIGKFKLLNEAIDFIDECIDYGNKILNPICDQLVEGEVCILNRQPSLHRLGMLGFKIKLTDSSVIKIHPLVCAPYNADFDGDQMAAYIPVSQEAKNEIIEKLFVTQNLSSPSNEELTTIPSQDIILGIYTITSGKFKALQSETTCKETTMSEGEAIFNQSLPKDYPVVLGSVDKKRLLDILNDIKEKYTPEETKVVLDEIKMVGFKYATIFGTTMSIDGFVIPDIETIRTPVYSSRSIPEQVQKSSDPEIIEHLRKHFPYSFVVDSGARGKWDQVKQLIFSRGFISNFDGDILQSPIKHNLLEGLTEEEFFNSTYGCRKGLLDVALNTGSSGYLSRKLIFTCANLQIDDKLVDCGTTDYLEIEVDSESKAKMLVKRFYYDRKKIKEITPDNYKSLIGKTIKLRSPIFCKSEKLCHTCYGNLFKSLHSKFVGVIAAQTLGERGTQLVLRTFHTSGSAQVTEDSGMRQMDIIGDLSTISGLLHNRSLTYKELVDSLYKVYGSNQDMYHVHFECVVAQLMWVGHRKWRLLENRDKIESKYLSIQSVPSQESWILGLAFSNPKKHILKGIMHSGHYKGIMDKILTGEKI